MDARNLEVHVFRTSFVTILAALICGGIAAETIELDRCIGGKCHRNGRYDAVQITADYFIVYINADRCPGRSTHCSTSYDSFTAPDGTALETGGYVLGERTRGTIKVYVPRQYKGLYVGGINGSKRDDLLALTDFEDYSQARNVVSKQPDVETSIDMLFDMVSEAFATQDADRAAAAYAKDASYMGDGDTVRGRAAIRETFAEVFDAAREQGEELAMAFDRGERVVEGRLAYETGYFTLTRRGQQGERISRGKYVVVMRFTEGQGWSYQVDAFSLIP